jgi:uncharacterized protein (DUF433 family)
MADPLPLPPPRIPHPHVVIDPKINDGSPIIEGTRVPVRRIFGWHRQGTTVETLLRRYPQLGPARILDALAFAYDNLDLMTADLLREREQLARDDSRLRQEVSEAREITAQRSLPWPTSKDDP